MSIIIDGIAVTGCVAQGGIQESTQRVYASDSSSLDASQSKGAHYVYNISAQIATDVKETLSDCVAKNAVNCTIGGDTCRAEMTNFTASLAIEHGDLALWDVSFTLTDIELSNESGEEN